jgi:hypothetical protein
LKSIFLLLDFFNKSETNSQLHKTRQYHEPAIKKANTLSQRFVMLKCSSDKPVLAEKWKMFMQRAAYCHMLAAEHYVGHSWATLGMA